MAEVQQLRRAAGGGDELLRSQKSYADVLDSIDKKLTSLDARLDLVKVSPSGGISSSEEFLEFSQEQPRFAHN
ncbi:hypothetical protein CRENBAI_007598 [Crenichthys baileyi]|uniref:Uncharacterized protein n=1 Tax=Crenichthys baileyi TaxID=28760 RepID=A0AAV9RUR7_9TELE